jgi:hypothetical protein
MPVSVTKTAVKDADGIGTSVTATIFVPPIIVVREDGEQKISQALSMWRGATSFLKTRQARPLESTDQKLWPACSLVQKGLHAQFMVN